MHQVYQIHVLLSVNVQHCTEKVLAASKPLHYFPCQPIQRRLRVFLIRLFVFFWAPARKTHPLSSALLQRDLGNGFFFPLSKGTDTDYLLVWQLQLAAAMDGIIRQIPTVERRSVSSPGDIQQNPSRATWETLFPGLIWLKRCSRDISSENAGLLHHGRAFFFSFLLSFLSSRLWFIKLTVTQCALSLGAIPIYSPHHHCRPRRPQTLSAASHQPSPHYPSHRRMLGQY